MNPLDFHKNSIHERYLINYWIRKRLIHWRHLGFRLGALIRYVQSIRNVSCAVETTDDGLEEDNI